MTRNQRRPGQGHDPKGTRSGSRGLPPATRRATEKARALHEGGRTAEAIELLRAEAGKGGAHPHLIAFLGALEFFSGLADIGLERGGQAAAMAPDDPAILSNYGAQLLASGRPGDAVAVLRKALDLQPAARDAHFNLARALAVGERFADAEEVARAYMAAWPDDPKGYGVLYDTLMRENRFAEAKQACHRLLERDPGSVDAHVGLIDLSIAAGDLAEARSCLEDLVGNRPSLVNDAVVARRIDLVAMTEGPESAAALCAEILKGRPGAAAIAKARRSMLLLAGRFEEGWRAFGAEGDRLARIGSLPHRVWRGEKSDERTLLIRGAEGVGEQLLYSQLLPRVRARVRRLIVECDHRLVPPLSRTFADIEFVAWNTPPQTRLFGADIDLQCLPRDLGQIFLRSMADIEGPPRSLAGNPAGAAAASALRARYPGKRLIGISWRSSSGPTGGGKSVPLTRWADILTCPDATFVNLQYGATESEVGQVRDRLGVDIVAADGVDMTDDIDRAIGLVSGLDLVITVSNATAHYAGNVGVPCWVLVGKAPLWHWFTARRDSPWYPSVRLYRQNPAETWDRVLRDIADDLRGSGR